MRSALLIVGLLAASSLQAQPCTGLSDSGFPVFTGVGQITCSKLHDPDGSGPLPARLVVGGNFSSIGGVAARNVALWDGQTWTALGAGLPSAVFALASFDPDGPSGPQLPQVVASSNTVPDSNGLIFGPGVAAFNGSIWVRLGQLNSTFAPNALAVYDRDGSGPQAPQLFVGQYGAGISFPALAAWNSVSWTAVAAISNFGTEVRSMTTWDPDGAGPQQEVLVVAGELLSSKVTAYNGLTNIATQLSISGQATGRVLAITTWDPDGAGPSNAVLVAAGDTQAFSAANPASVATLSAIRGAWSPLGSGPGALQVNTLAAFDLDGAGPLLPRLFAGGRFRIASGAPGDFLASWDGSAWSGYAQGPANTVNTLAAFDPDGAGAQPASLTLGGNFATVGRSPITTVNAIARFDGSSFQSLSTGALGGNQQVRAMTHWDPDGAGPLAPRIAAVGTFTSVNGQPGRVAISDGTNWTALDAPIDGPLYAVAAWDADGSGPEPEQLVVTGDFTRLDAADARSVASYSPSSGAWTALPGDLAGSATLATAFDTDADPATPAQLLINGEFPSIPGTTTSRAAVRRGINWDTTLSGQNFARFNALTLHDADGPNGAPPRLAAAGSFTSSDTALWDGQTLSPLPTNTLSPFEMAMASWDTDGSGPLPPELYSAGASSTAQLTRLHNNAWELVNLPFSSTFVQILTTFAPADTQPSLLVAGGSFLLSGITGTTFGYHGLFDGRRWVIPLDLVSAPVSMLQTRIGAAPGTSRLLVGGSSSTTSTLLRELSLPTSPVISGPPEVVRVRLGRTATISASVTGQGPITVNWIRNRSALRNGTTLTDQISGAETTSLGIANITAAAAGEYFFVARDTCAAVAVPTRLIVACTADTDYSGAVTLQDLFDYINLFLAGNPEAEINGVDGVTVQDLFDYLAAYFTPCA